ncbi:MAG: ATP-binding protein [Armatimonadota bacterium]|nr:PAS domain S-box protein [bacterium]
MNRLERTRESAVENQHMHDPEHVTITDVMTKDQLMDISRAFRLGGQASAGIFVFGDACITLVDEFYGEAAPEHPVEILEVAEVVHNTAEPYRMIAPNGAPVYGQPIWLHYEGKSYLKGCFAGIPTKVVYEDPAAVLDVAKLVADTISDRVSAGYISQIERHRGDLLEQMLKQNNDPLADVINRMSAGLLLINRDMNIIWHNTVAARDTGNESLVGKKCFKYIHRHDKICDDCLVKQTFESGRAQSGSISAVLRGEAAYLNIVTTPVFDDKGNITQVLEVVHNITDVRRSQHELAHYKRLVNSSDDFMAIMDQDKKIIAVNRKIIDELGYSESEIIGQYGKFIIADNDCYKAQAMSDVLSEVGMAIDSLHFQRRDGSTIPVQLFASYDNKNDVFEVIARDMSERLAMEQQIKDRSAELQEQNKRVTAAIEERDRFFRSVSHELRTPLTSVIGFAELLLEDTDEPLSDRQKAQLNRVVGNSHKLLGMVNDLLDLSKLEAGRIQIEPADVDLREFLEQVANNMMPLANNKKLTIDVRVDIDQPVVTTDEQKLGQVIVNLLSNAIKFTQSGGVTVSASGNENEVFISVADTGVGISEDEIEDIFKEFYQNRKQGAGKLGTGLGLSIARKLTTALGGRLEVNSRLGEGSTFTMSLPVRFTDEDAEPIAI